MKDQPTTGIPNYLGYWAKVLASFLVFAAIWWLAVPVVSVPTPVTDKWARIQTYKSQIAAHTPSPKLLLVGASGTFFGLRADVLNRELSIPAVNLGLQASFGLRYLLERSKRDVHSGDVVLLTVEYGLLRDKPGYTAGAIEYLYAGDTDYLNGRPLQERILMPFRISPERLVTESLRNRAAGKIKNDPLRLVGPFGDGLYGKAGPTEKMKAAVKKPDVFNGAGPHPEGIAAIRDYADWCHAHGIRLLLTYPAYARLWDVDKPAAKSFFRKLEDAYVTIGVPVLGKPADFIYDGSWFFDTRYHLKRQFSEYSTLQRIPGLRPYVLALIHSSPESAQPKM